MNFFPMKSRTIFPMQIDDVGYGGRGIGRVGGKVVMVPGALPGETIVAALRLRRQRWDDAEVVEVTVSSPHRVAPVCPLAMQPAGVGGPQPSCPGCVYQHADYEFQRQLKRRQLETLLLRFAGIEAPVQDGASGRTYAVLGYRNKMVWHAQHCATGLRLGYAAGRRDRILDVGCCPLAHPELNALATDWRGGRQCAALRDGERVTFRHTASRGAVAWVNRAPDNAVWLRETTSLGALAVPRSSFFQVHPEMAEILLAWVRDRIEDCGAPTVVDLYCGIGVFALAAAAAGTPEVLGIDHDGPGIQAAAYNAHCLGSSNVTFEARPVGQALTRLAGGGRVGETLAVLDPPRAGLDAGALAALAQWAPRWILMVSCAADTLCRDLKALTGAGYEPERIGWFDMFPQTAGFETAVLLQRRH